MKEQKFRSDVTLKACVYHTVERQKRSETIERQRKTTTRKRKDESFRVHTCDDQSFPFARFNVRATTSKWSPHQTTNPSIISSISFFISLCVCRQQRQLKLREKRLHIFTLDSICTKCYLTTLGDAIDGTYASRVPGVN